MKCQRCPKQATLHITEVLGEDRYEEVHLCEDCAKKYLVEPHKKAASGTADDASEPHPHCRTRRTDAPISCAAI